LERSLFIVDLQTFSRKIELVDALISIAPFRIMNASAFIHQRFIVKLDDLEHIATILPIRDLELVSWH
jgi:hypothetical protein